MCGGYHPLLFMGLQKQSNKISSWIVGKTTRHELEGPGIESRCGQDILHHSRLALESTQPPIQWVQSFFPGVKRLRLGVNQSRG